MPFLDNEHQFMTFCLLYVLNVSIKLLKEEDV